MFKKPPGWIVAAELVETQPKHHKAVLYASLTLSTPKNGAVFTGDVYELYKDLCTKVGLRPLTQRRVSDVLSELDMIGILNAKVISKGRYGRTREISVNIPQSAKTKTLSLLRDTLSL